jgi:hypothetical protein
MYYSPNTEVSRSSDTPLYARKEQKINDRLQDKINILKSQVQESRIPLQASDARLSKDNSLTTIFKRPKEREI